MSFLPAVFAVVALVPAALAQPSVPGFEVAIYASVPDPVSLSFDAATGILYVGRDNDGSGGTNADAVRIHRVGAGGAGVTEYGAAAIDDPDAVLFDAAGTASEGAPGSVIVGGVNAGRSQGQLVAIRPDESVEPIDGPTTDYDNPTSLVVDGTGRVLMSDLRTNGSGQVLVVTGAGAPTPLIAIAGVGALFLAVDAQDRIFVSKTDGTVAQYDAAGALLDASYATGLGGGPAIAVARGGGFGSALYAIDRTAGSLVRVDALGTQTTIGTGFQDVRGMTFGPDGALYVSEFGNDRVLRIEPAFSAEWRGASGSTPDQVCPAWTLTDTAEPEDPVLGAGVLAISTSENGENVYYGQVAPVVSIPDQLVIETRARFVEGSSATPARATGFVGWSTQPIVGNALFIDRDEIFLLAANDARGASATVDTDDAPHTYRIVVDGTVDGSLVTVFYDGAPTLTGVLFTSGDAFAPTPRIIWGEASLVASGALEFESFRHNAAICTTTSTTTTSTSSTVITTTTIVASTTTTSMAPTTTTTTSTVTSSSTTVPSTTTSTTIAGTGRLLPGRKLLVKQKKSGAQRLQMLVKDAGITAAQPCETDGELRIQAAGAPVTSFSLDAALWKPINAKKPERGCKYRKGPVVATVQIKTGKALKIVANADELGIQLAIDPRPVWIELRHGAVRHCLEFGGQGAHKVEKKLLARKAPQASRCPGTP